MTTVREARAAYFARSGFDERTYSDDWVLLRFGPVPVAFPNTQSRKKAVRIHDVHHALTGYAADWQGETSISAWEIASGCGAYGAAWVINLGGLALGSVLHTSTTFGAFVRGCRSGNLYAGGHDALERVLDDDVEVVRARVRVAPAVHERATLRERVAYAAWVATAWALWSSPLLALAALVAFFAF